MNAASEPAMAMQGVSKSLGGHQALRDIRWQVSPATITGLVGTNGAGKTTLLRLALGLLWPDAGVIRVLGMPLGRENAELRQRVGYVGADGQPLPALRVDEWTRYLRGMYRRWDDSVVRRLLAAMAIGGTRRIGTLSLGERSSLKMALAIAARPDLLLLDEPTNGLDVVVRAQMLKLVVDVAAREGTTVVLASHTLSDVERLADDLAILHEGRLLMAGRLDDLKARVRRIQAHWPRGSVEELAAAPHVLRVEQSGQMVCVTVDGPIEPVAALLRARGAQAIDVAASDLESLFREFIHREGYARDAVSWVDALYEEAEGNA